jgi:pimeloyl-ACP methyl ester carboxylesterase
MLGPVSGDLDIRYARNGDVHLAYRVLGDGPIDLVFVQGILTHLRVSWEYAGFRRFCEQLASFSRVILFDKRGMGMSDRVAVGTLEDRMDDVRAVMDAAGSERAALLGVSEGAPMSILFAATYPERTHALLLCGAEVREETDADWPWGESTREEFEVAMDTLSERWGRPEWAARALEAFIPSAAGDPGFRQWWTRALTDAASPGAAMAFMRMAFDIDVRHVLPSVHVPALVVHRSGDRVCHIENGRYIARNIAGARYVELDGEDHIPFGPGGGEIVAEVREFLTGVRGPVESDRVLATVVFTDIVGSTARAVDLGAGDPVRCRRGRRRRRARDRDPRRGAHGRVRAGRRQAAWHRGAHWRPRRRRGGPRRGARVEHRPRPGRRLGAALRGAGDIRPQGSAGRVAVVRSRAVIVEGG